MVKGLLDAKFISKPKYTWWFYNFVLVKKAYGKWRICVDYVDLNRVCLKDSYLLLNIDKPVENSTAYQLLSFMDSCWGIIKYIYSNSTG